MSDNFLILKDAEISSDANAEHIPHSDVWRMTAWDVLDRVIGKMAESDQTYADVSFDVVVGGSLAKLTARFDLTFDVDDETEVDYED